MRIRTSTTLTFVLSFALLLAPTIAFAGEQAQSSAYIVGYVYHDVDMDGSRDPGEPGLEDVEIHMTHSTRPAQIQYTNSNGLFYFQVSASGFYELEHMHVPGYDSTDNTRTVYYHPGYSGVILFRLVSSPDMGIGGGVYDDLNRDGVWDPDEPGVPEATVELLSADGGKITEAVSAEDGSYSFPDLESGVYTLIETDPSGYNSTTPNRREIELTEVSGMQKVNFGDFQSEEGEFTPVDLAVLNYFDLPLLDLLELRDGTDWGYGEIARALFLADLSDSSLEEIMAMRAAGAGWGEISDELGGDADLKGFNLGRIMSGRDEPDGGLSDGRARVAEACGLDPEQYAGYVGTYGQGMVNKACKLPADVGVPAENVFSMLESGMSLQDIEASLEDPPAALPSLESGYEHDGPKGPKPCKGKNKHNPDC